MTNTLGQILKQTIPFFNNLNILRVNDIYVYQFAIFMYLCFKKPSPNTILQYFQLNKNIHGHHADQVFK